MVQHLVSDRAWNTIAAVLASSHLYPIHDSEALQATLRTEIRVPDEVSKFRAGDRRDKVVVVF